MGEPALEAPLAGIKVLEIGVAMAGPFCAMTLGDYGADVIKIERVGEGDESRQWVPSFPGGVSYYFAAANRNKRSLAIDLKHKDGVDVLKRLAATADVLIDNFRVGALENLGLGYEALAAINPRLIYCTISGFGPNGPRAHERANDIFMQAYSGNMSITGEEGRGPVKAGISVADLGAGMFGVIGILLAIEARHKTGRGQRVDTSLLEGQIAMLSYHLTYYFASGRVPVRRGAASPVAVPYQGFKAKDDWVVVAAFTERMWQGVCRAIGRPEWMNDERFRGTARRANRETLIPMLEEIFAKRTVDEWIERLSAEGVPCSPVNPIDKVVNDEQVKAREMIIEVDHPTAGKIRMAGLPVELGTTPGSVRLPPPRLGEHSAQILREIGLSAQLIDALFQKGVIATPR
ncbi:MAG: CoA transferase [Betaproteobacteria bacterium]|nr:CoA transferase [Betaproteobacteria bacterium]